jgi:hypothetical protein
VSRSVRRAGWSALVAGVLPILAVNLAFWINVQEGLAGCFPYLDGCWSVSRAVRDGPGLLLFKGLVLPTAVAMVLTWWWLPPTLSGTWTRRLGVIGALALLVYAAALGTDGDFYKWMRRYGVVFYFGCTGIAQLLVANRLWRLQREQRRGLPPWPVAAYLLLALLTWGVGLLSAFKRRLFDDPALVDQVENAAEWSFALGLALLFVVLAAVLRKGLHNPA